MGLRDWGFGLVGLRVFGLRVSGLGVRRAVGSGAGWGVGISRVRSRRLRALARHKFGSKDRLQAFTFVKFAGLAQRLFLSLTLSPMRPK